MSLDLSKSLDIYCFIYYNYRRKCLLLYSSLCLSFFIVFIVDCDVKEELKIFFLKVIFIYDLI